MNTEPQVLERRGARLRYWLDGPPGRPLVALTHGMALDHRIWERQVAALAGRYQVLTWDLPGHGLSHPAGGPLSAASLADDLLMLLYRAGRQRAALVGHSLGGAVAQELAFRYPARVSALAVSGCSCITLPRPAPLRLAARAAPALSGLLGALPRWPLARLAVAPMAERPAARAAAADMASRTSRAGFLGAVAALAGSGRDEPGYRFRGPLLLLYGERDRFGRPAAAARAWAARDTQARVVPIPGAGHNAGQDSPEAYTAALLAFLDAALTPA